MDRDRDAQTVPAEPADDVSAACAAIRVAVRAFLTGANGAPAGAALRRMREHLAGCPACDAAYREEAAFVAALGRAGRRTRERKGVPRQGRGARWRYLAAPRQTRLRLVLIPAFAIFLMTQSDRLRSQSGWRVEALDGVVVAEGERVAPTETSERMVAGEVCSTGSTGGAVLRFGDTLLVLGPDTELVVGSSVDRSVRLSAGRVVAGGPCSLETPLAWIDVDDGASARVEVAGGGLAVECLSGAVAVQDVTGTHELAPGERLQR